MGYDATNEYSRRSKADILEYLKNRHSNYTFGITDKGDFYVEGELSEEEEDKLFNSLKGIGLNVYLSPRKTVE